MPYLSRIPINPLRPQGRRLLANPQVTHASICQAFPMQNPGRTLWRMERVHTRAELLVLSPMRPSWAQLVETAGWPGADGGEAQVADVAPLLDLVQVGREFSFKVRVNTAFTTMHPKAENLKRKLADSPSARPGGVRVGHRTAAQQMAWFVGKSTGWGFEIPLVAAGTVEQEGGEVCDVMVPDVILVERENLRFWKGNTDSSRIDGGGTDDPRLGLSRADSQDGPAPRKQKAPPVTLSVGTFQGRLRVVDSEKMRTSLVGGIGRARAYGCGLVTLASVRQSMVVDGA